MLCCTLLSAASVEARTIFFSNSKTANHTSFTLSDNELSARVKNLNLPMEARLTTPVRTKIRRYVTVGSLESQNLLGRTALYFPVFEHYLRVYDLPQSLKYLPLVESRLLPEAVSPASAAGLWQFMPATARSLGLHINGSVDERLDTHRSTEAAVKMLAELYERYDDWPWPWPLTTAAPLASTPPSAAPAISAIIGPFSGFCRARANYTCRPLLPPLTWWNTTTPTS